MEFTGSTNTTGTASGIIQQGVLILVTALILGVILPLFQSAAPAQDYYASHRACDLR